MRIILALILFGACALARAAVNPFVAPPQPTGTLEVRLHATEGIAAGTPKLVTFGVPFPRGSVTNAELANVRVFENGTEVPAYVAQLTPWRHRNNAALDGASVRVARIQIQHNVAATFPGFDTIEVRWGGAARTQSRAFVDPRTAWHLVTSGTFVAADNVFEPDVYAVLPRGWLAQGLLRPARSAPLAADDLEPRDNPATNDAIAHWPGFQESERALKNNFYSVINQDDPLVTAANQCPYKTEREPWLYDRSATMYVLHARSGFFAPLREAVRAAQFYANHLDAQGFFVPFAAGDSKYSYNESLAYTYWLTGDDQMLPKIATILAAHAGYPHVWTPARNFWTERHSAFKLLANVVAYEVNGGAAQRDAVEQLLADFRAHQDGAGGQIPAQRIDGGLYHLGAQHDYDWDDTAYGGSSWMTVLLTDAALRAYQSGEDLATAQFIRRAGNFLKRTIVTTDEHSYDTYEAPLALPRYAMLIDGTDGQRNYEDIEHALDVAGQLAWAWYFSDLTGAPDLTLKQAALALYDSYDEGVNYWIRPGGPAAGLPAFRTAPWRKWGWEHRTSDGLAFALSDGYPPVFEDGFETRLALRRALSRGP
jgi:hypothetical protein